MGPKVSIIIPFYNCGFVDQAIQSALSQTYRNMEIILVDDGSTKFTEKITPYKGRIGYLRKENGGTATALNHGINAATGEYIAWLSSDDYFLPEKISKQMSFMLKHNAEASFTNYDYIDENNKMLIPWCGMRFTNQKDIYNAFMKYNVVNGCTVMIKKDLLKKMGLFNPFYRYTHDYEMWFRLLVNGYKMYYLDENLTKFRSHKDSGTNKHQAEMKKEMDILESHYRPMLAEYIKKT